MLCSNLQFAQRLPGYTFDKFWLENVVDDITNVIDDVTTIVELTNFIEPSQLNSEMVKDLLPKLQYFLLENQPDRIFEKWDIDYCLLSNQDISWSSGCSIVLFITLNTLTWNQAIQDSSFHYNGLRFFIIE